MISINNFKKLGQLDRIEYLLKKQSLGERPSLSDGLGYHFSLFGMVFLLCFATLMAGIGAEGFFELLRKLLILFVIATGLQIILNGISMHQWSKSEKQIESEYFSLEPRGSKVAMLGNLTKINPLELMKQVKLIQPMVEEELKKQKKSTKKKR